MLGGSLCAREGWDPFGGRATHAANSLWPWSVRASATLEKTLQPEVGSKKVPTRIARNSPAKVHETEVGLSIRPPSATTGGFEGKQSGLTLSRCPGMGGIGLALSLGQTA